MNLRPLLAAAAVSVLAAGAAHAQVGSSAQPGTGVTPNQSTPAPATQSSTGLPSVDSSRPTGSGAGATNLPNGEVGVSATTDSTGTSLGTPSGTTSAGATADSSVTAGATTGTGAAASATTAAGDASTGASVTTSTTTNGPVPDTAENRAKYGGPMSRAGKRTAARGN